MIIIDYIELKKIEVKISELVLKYLMSDGTYLKNETISIIQTIMMDTNFIE